MVCVIDIDVVWVEERKVIEVGLVVGLVLVGMVLVEVLWPKLLKIW